MPLYHFHVRNGERLTDDLQGLNLPNVDAAVTEARNAARDILIDFARDGKTIGIEQFDICDPAGRLMAIVKFRDCQFNLSLAPASLE
jgi:uncharacterized protein YuzE